MKSPKTILDVGAHSSHPEGCLLTTSFRSSSPLFISSKGGIRMIGYPSGFI